MSRLLLDQDEAEFTFAEALADVRKFNPNHDELGRFTFSDFGSPPPGGWQSFAENTRSALLKLHKTYGRESTRLNKNLDELMRSAAHHKDMKTWYADYKQQADKLFGKDAELFSKFLAASSAGQSGEPNMQEALRAYEHYLTADDPFGKNDPYHPAGPYGASTLSNYRNIAAGADLSGHKVPNFYMNLTGHLEPVTTDVHMARLLFRDFKEGSIKTGQEHVANAVVGSMAHSMGWRPAELQAALWAVRKAGEENGNAANIWTYEKSLINHAAQINAITQGVHRRGAYAISKGSYPLEEQVKAYLNGALLCDIVRQIHDVLGTENPDEQDVIDLLGLDVSKFNPNHDELGRFAEGPGGGGTDAGKLLNELGPRFLHGTLRENVPAIRSLGLSPMAGPFVESAYGGDYESAGAKLPELVYLSSEADRDRAFNAIKAQIAFKLGKDYHAVTTDDIRQHGALVVTRSTDVREMREDQTSRDLRGRTLHEYDDASTAEPGDWYSFESLQPTGVLTGDRLLRFMHIAKLMKGEGPGHPFRGNQYTTGEAGGWTSGSGTELESVPSVREAVARGAWRFKPTGVREGYSEKITSYRVEPNDIPDNWQKSVRPITGTEVLYDPEVAHEVDGYVQPKDPDAMQMLPEEPEPNTLYRGMSHEEYQQAKERGYFESSGGYNLGEEQKGLTYFSSDPQQAESYANGFAPWQYIATPSRPAVVVAVNDPGDHVVNPHLPTEIGLRGRVPTSAVKSVFVGRPYEVVPGHIDVVSERGRPSSEGSRLSPHASLIWSRQGDISKFNPHHDPETGRFDFAPGGAADELTRQDLYPRGRPNIDIKHATEVIHGVAREHGINPDLIHVSEELNIRDGGIVVAGTFHRDTKDISIWPNAVPKGTDGELAGLAAHEITHLKYDEATASTDPDIKALLDPHFTGPNLRLLQTDDGVSKYSKGYWGAAERQIANLENLRASQAKRGIPPDKQITYDKIMRRSITETLAEMAERKQRTGKLYGSPRWKALYNDVQTAFTKLQERRMSAMPTAGLP